MERKQLYLLLSACETTVCMSHVALCSVSLKFFCVL